MEDLEIKILELFKTYLSEDGFSEEASSKILESIDLKTNFNDIGMDSLDKYFLSYTVEQNFEIIILDEKIICFRNLNEYKEYIKNFYGLNMSKKIKAKL